MSSDLNRAIASATVYSLPATVILVVALLALIATFNLAKLLIKCFTEV